MSREKTLQRIFSHFQQMTQWVWTPDNYAKYYNKAESLIETLEIEDCGSVGGFDKENPKRIISGFDLYDRFLTLIRKEKTVLKKEIYFTVETMIEYWRQIRELREKFNK